MGDLNGYDVNEWYYMFEIDDSVEEVAKECITENQIFGYNLRLLVELDTDENDYKLVNATDEGFIGNEYNNDIILRFMLINLGEE